MPERVAPRVALAGLLVVGAASPGCDVPPPQGYGGGHYHNHGILPPIDPSGAVYVDPSVEPEPPQPPRCADAWAARSELDYDPARDAGPEGYARYHARLRRSECRKRWTVLLYMEADVSDLAPFALWNLLDMETPRPEGSAASTARADVIAQLDLPGGDGVRRLHVLPRDQPAPARVDHKMLQKTGISALRSPTVELRAREGGAPEDDLRDFIEWGRRRYPADNLMLILWGHGAGWRGARGSGRLSRACPAKPDGSVDFLGDGGFGPDCNERTVLDIPGLRAAIRRAGGVDLLITDACLLQTVEVTTELADVAPYIVGYEQVAPHAGLPYRELIPRVNGSVGYERRGCSRLGARGCPQGDAACALARRVPDIYCGAVLDDFFVARARGTSDKPARESFTISAVYSAELKRALLPALDELGDALVPYLEEDPFRGIDLYELLKPGGLPGFEGETRDLAVFLRGLEGALSMAESMAKTDATQRVRAALDETRRALDRAVLSAAWGSDYATHPGGLGGLSMWLPKCKNSYRAKRDDFASSRFYRALRRGVERPAWPERPTAGSGDATSERGWDDWIAAVLEPQPDCI